MLGVCTYGGIGPRFSRIGGSGPPPTGYSIYVGLNHLCQLYISMCERVNLRDRTSRFSFSRRSDISFVGVREWIKRSVVIINWSQKFWLEYILYLDRHTYGSVGGGLASGLASLFSSTGSGRGSGWSGPYQ
jgi:hypothetical protein